MLFRSPGFIPDTVIIDPEYRIISANNSSKKIILPTSGFADVLLYPNPVRNENLNVFLHDFEDDNATISLVNAAGQQIMKWNLPLNQGRNMMRVDMSNYAKGVYFLIINTTNKKITKKIINRV